MTFNSRAAWGGALALTVVAAASPAFAQAAGGVGGNLTAFLQNIVDLMNSGVVRLIAILAVIACGAGWMFGHLDFRRAATVVMGIIVVFGAATIVDVITGGSHA